MVFELGKGIDLEKCESQRYKDAMARFDSLDFENRFPHFKVNGLPFYLDPKMNTVGVDFSGGTDSSLLMYVLCEAIKQQNLDMKVYPLTFARHWEENKWNEDAKTNVYSYLRDSYPDIIQDQIWALLPTPYEFTPVNRLEFGDDAHTPHWMIDMGVRVELYHTITYDKWAARHFGFGAIYNGTTMVPEQNAAVSPDRPFENLPEHRIEDDMSKVEENRLVWETQEFGAHFMAVNPFYVMEKDWIMAQYDYFNQTELLDLTVSCEEELGGCGTCFHCKEKAWGIANKDRILKALIK